MTFLLFLILYNEGGNEYDSPHKKTLIQVEKSTTDIVIAQEVENIIGGSTTDSAFFLCRSVIRSVSFAKNSNLKELGISLFERTSLQSIDFTNCLFLEKISDKCFANCAKIINVTLPSKIKILGIGSFFECSIVSLNIPDSLETISDLRTYGVFHNCKSLKELKIGKNSNLTKIGSCAFLGSTLQRLFIPKSLTQFGMSAIASAPLEEITCDEENDFFSTDGRAIYSKDGSILYSVSCYEYPNDFIVKKNVKEITIQAFRGVPGNTVIFENPNVKITTQAFSSSSIKNISYPSGNTFVVDSCFSSSGLEYAYLPKSITIIHNSAFSACSKLKEVYLNEGLQSIGSMAFARCTQVKLIIPKSVTSIGISCFSNVPIENITFLNDFFKVIDDILYCNDTLIDYIGNNVSKEIIIPSSVKNIPLSMFYQKQLKSITFQEIASCTSFGQTAFASSTLETIIFPSSLTSISQRCFAGCRQLKKVVMKGNIKTIPDFCFDGCDNLQTIEIDDINSIISIGEHAFSGCKKLSFDFSKLNQLESIGSNAFSQTNCTVVRFPSTLQTIDSYCFSGSQLETVYFSYAEASSIRRFMFSSSPSTIPSYCFSQCSKLKNFYSGDSPTSIDNYAFQKCSSLQSMTLGKNIEKLEVYSFVDCTMLISITIPKDSHLSEI